MLAQATTPNHVLDAWVLFRYRHPKRIYHYMMTLKRLVEVGGCEATDWRLQVLLSRLRGAYRRVINFDILLRYFSELGLYKEMEGLTRFLRPRLENMKPKQLVSVMQSFGKIQLRDPAIMGLCMRGVGRNFDALSTKDCIGMISALGNVEVRSPQFISVILGEILKRELSIDQFCDLIAATRSARYRDYSLAELAVHAGRKLLELKSEDLSPVCRLVYELNLLGINDVRFIADVVSQVEPDRVSVSSLIGLVASAVGKVDAFILKPYFEVIQDSVILLEKKPEVCLAAEAVDSLMESLPKGKQLLSYLARRLAELPREDENYNVVKFAGICLRNQIYSRKLWKCILSDTRSSLPDFEPLDFLSTARLFSELPSDVVGDRMNGLPDELSEWALKRWEEFSHSQWIELTKYLVSNEKFQCSDWSKKEFEKWGEMIRKNNKKSHQILNRYRSSVS